MSIKRWRRPARKEQQKMVKEIAVAVILTLLLVGAVLYASEKVHAAPTPQDRVVNRGQVFHKPGYIHYEWVKVGYNTYWVDHGYVHMFGEHCTLYRRTTRVWNWWYRKKVVRYTTYLSCGY